MSLTPKQKAARANAVGSSDSTVIAGVSPYKGILELFYQFTGKLPRYTEEETRYQKIGSMLEGPIGQFAAKELGLKIRREPPRIHPRHTFMTCNLDFGIVSHTKGPGIYEVKNRAGQRPWETLPDDITIQTAHQMAVTQREWGIVVGLFQFGEIKTYEVERDPEIEEYLIELEARFMLRVQKNEPPTEAWTPETIGLLKKLYPTDSGKAITLSEGFADAAMGFLSAKAELEADKTIIATHEGVLKRAMEDASLATIPGFGEITWKSTRAGQKFNEDLFANDHPALYKEYMKPVPGHRRFIVKPSKEVSCLPKKSPSESLPTLSSPAPLMKSEDK